MNFVVGMCLVFNGYLYQVQEVGQGTYGLRQVFLMKVQDEDQKYESHAFWFKKYINENFKVAPKSVGTVGCHN
jgi:hypothetical protein